MVLPSTIASDVLHALHARRRRLEDRIRRGDERTRTGEELRSISTTIDAIGEGRLTIEPRSGDFRGASCGPTVAG